MQKHCRLAVSENAEECLSGDILISEDGILQREMFPMASSSSTDQKSLGGESKSLLGEKNEESATAERK